MKLREPLKLITGFIFWGVFLCAFSIEPLQAQQPIGGPYQADSSTVLLLHFNGDYENEVDATADAQPYGNTSFDTLDSAGVFGQQLWFDNDSPEDKSHLQVPDTASLDLTGSWTMQAWVNVFTFGTGQTGWPPDRARILLKPGDPHEAAYYQMNYSIYIYGVNRDFMTGYYSVKDSTWIDIRSPNNLFNIGEWYHVTFLRDTSKKLIVQMIHQNASDAGRLPGYASDSLERVYLEAFNFEKAGQTGQPRTSDQPLFIGATPQNDTLFNNLRGWLDEIHISNTVRSYNVPPIISGVTQLEHQPTNQDYEVKAKIQTIGDNKVTSATLHYRVDSETWMTLSMVEGADNRYTARIPSQSVGSEIDYWIEATASDGQRATHPRSNPAQNAYNFGVWRDSSRVLHLPFNEGSGIPTDQSSYESAVTFHSAAANPAYVQGDGGDDDYAIEFNAADSTWLEVSSPFHELTHFTLDFKFYAQDSIPPEDTRLIAKGDPSALYYSNYQVNFDPNGAVRPAIYAANNRLDPCGEFTGGCLLMDGTNERIEADTWYRVQLGIRGPGGLTADTGRIFAHLLEVATGDTVAKRVHPVDAGATPNQHSLKIGGTGDYTPYFNGLIDDLSLYNYVPSKIFTSTPERSSPLPQNITLEQNYPNPFNPATTIEYSVIQPTRVQLTVFDVLGRKVVELVNSKKSAGTYQVTFDAEHLSSGVYLYKLEAGDVTKTRKMLLIK